jgi:peptide-methionine (S)-S-oxide reductase
MRDDKKMRSAFTVAAAVLALGGCGSAKPDEPMRTSADPASTDPVVQDPSLTDTATFGAGCFWCVDAIFRELDGVMSVTAGYAGGHTQDPDYKSVCSGTTGHAEVAQIVYDPKKISYDELLEVFWQTHDPTTLNRQGADVGTQYRSVIFHHNAEQKQKAERYKAELDQSGAWDKPIITEIGPLERFYPAENYHQDYYAANPDAGYCQYVIRPKLEKFRKVFADKLKP